MGTGIEPERPDNMTTAGNRENESVAQEMKESLCHRICGTFSLPEQEAKQYSPLNLAYIGDAVYEVIIRTIHLARGTARVNVLH